MATSTNYGWAEPDNSSLVKNGASDIRTLGDAIDTSVWNVGYGQAGKNKLINGDFNINQRSFTSTTSAGFTVDRWQTQGSGGTVTRSVQSFTPGAAPVAGYEATNFLRIITASQSANADYAGYLQSIEDVRTFANQTITVSFYAKASTGTPKVGITSEQNFGSGGSAATYTSNATTTISTSWARYSVTLTIPSISGKTIGTSSFNAIWLFTSCGSTISALGYPAIGLQNTTIDIWGVQAEYGSKATPFQTASGGSPQAELAMCQRYYWRQTAVNANERAGYGSFTGSTNFQSQFNFPVTMRAQSTAVEIVGVSINDTAAVIAVTGGNVNVNSPFQGNLSLNVASGGTQFRFGAVTLNTASTSYIGFSAEL
jgi:hypothetical protein